MKVQDFEVFKALLYQKSGLVITPDKSYLLESRLAPVIRTFGIPDMEILTQKLRESADQKLITAVVEAMTTNETMFFRDQKPFDKFRDFVVPGILKDRGPGPIRIWSAACSSGQEPYTLGITIKENRHRWPGTSFEILATDLSTDILAKAKEGKYSQFEVQRGMPTALLIKYFTQTGEIWTIKDDIRNMVKFQPFNLLDPFESLGMFDIIYCRNVLIYFDQATKGKILEKMARRLHRHGYLFLGGAETVLGITQSFKPLEGERGLYVPTGA